MVKSRNKRSSQVGDGFICVYWCVQDVDSAYLVKADLEDKVGSLTDEINFLRNIYEEVFSWLSLAQLTFPLLPYLHISGVFIFS